jgi:hypothetical protein
MDRGLRAGVSLRGAMSESRGEADRRKDFKKGKEKRGHVVTPQRIGITEHNPTQIFGKKNVKTQTTAKGKGNNDIR